MAHVTLEDVKIAVGQLESLGSSVSVASVRGHLGRGSATTITRHLREVREAKARERLLEPLNPDDVSPEIVERITAAAKAAGIESFRAIAEPLNRKIEEAKAALAAERQTMQQDMAQVVAESYDATERLDILQRETSEAIRREAAALAELASARDQLQKLLSERQLERERQTEELSTLRQYLTEAQSENRRVQERVEVAIGEAAELRGRLAASTERALRGS